MTNSLTHQESFNTTEVLPVLGGARLARQVLWWCAAAWGLSSAPAAIAQARFTPPAAQIVLPSSVHTANGQRGALRDIEQAWRKAPKDLDASLRYARAVFLIGLTEGDLRWYGSAKAALQPWWTATTLPAQGYYLRALVRQGFHDFQGGIQDLNAAIAADPTQSEFWSWRFSLHLLTSDMAAARADCQEIERRFGADEGNACLATLLYRTGQAQRAVELLDVLVERPDFQGGSAQDWLRFHQGEAHRTLGQNQRAIDIWEAHLKRRPETHGVRVALTDLLNQQGQFALAKRYAASKSPTDALLVQALLASQGLRDGETAALAEQVEGRLQSQALRQETLIERPQMIYMIRYGRHVAAGLTLAADNWTTQNEPADAVLLAEAALHQKQPKAAEPVLRWMEKTGYADPVLAPLAQQLKALLGRS